MTKLFLCILLTISSLSVSQNTRKEAAKNEYLLAENYYREGAYEKATQLFKKLYDASPFNSNYLGRLISCYQETDQFLIAENLLKNKIKANHSQVYLYVYLGYNFERQLKNEKAQENYEFALNSLEKKATYGGIIGGLFKEYNLLDHAILAYEKTMKLQKSANYNFKIAQIYGEKGNFKKCSNLILIW